MSDYSIGEAITAIGALGTAAFGLVDATKASRNGGVSRVGFDYISAALTPFESALEKAVGGNAWRDMLLAHWMNGRSLADQKAIARAMVRLGMAPENAEKIAVAGHVDSKALVPAVERLYSGTPLTEADLSVLGRVDASLEMTLDAAFERADQAYRNRARVVAAGFAILLAQGAAFVYDHSMGIGTDACSKDCAAWIGHTSESLAVWICAVRLETHFIALLVGLLAVPIAPITKDLTTSLSTAVNALKAARSVKG